MTVTAEPMPDFFPGAHAQLMRRKLAASDTEAFAPIFQLRLASPSATDCNIFVHLQIAGHP